MGAFVVSQGGIEDLDILVSHRIQMWRDIFPELGEAIDLSVGTTGRWLREKLLGGTVIPFIARTEDGHVAGSGCVMIKEDQPRPTSRTVNCPYLMSMYTEREFRRKGVATRITEEAIAWCRQNGYDRITLHASSEGRAIYEKLGFSATNEMKLAL